MFTGPRVWARQPAPASWLKPSTVSTPRPTRSLRPVRIVHPFRQSASFNIHELDAASNNLVDDIRTLVEQVRIPPQVGKYKIYIIDEVHMLTQAAFNAFLKTLEEPPSYAKFILATTENTRLFPPSSRAVRSTTSSASPWTTSLGIWHRWLKKRV
ncbi:MAG: hypothetical protein IPM52_10410 [Bacteroidetes bacterium]|nr:hypothetical protein [Bacteroidota bacterium]